VTNDTVAIDYEQDRTEHNKRGGNMFGLYLHRHDEKNRVRHFQLRENRAEGDDQCGDAAGSCKQNRRRRQKEKVTQLTADRATEIKIKKMLLPDDALEVAPDEVKHTDICGEGENARMQKQGGEKLPRVGMIDPAVTQPKIFAQRRRLINLQQLLNDKDGDVKPEQEKENNALARSPARRRRRSFPTGQAHELKLSQTLSLVIGKGAKPQMDSLGEEQSHR
jgi:hypothetical protein